MVKINNIAKYKPETSEVEVRGIDEKVSIKSYLTMAEGIDFSEAFATFVFPKNKKGVYAYAPQLEYYAECYCLIKFYTDIDMDDLGIEEINDLVNSTDIIEKICAYSNSPEREAVIKGAFKYAKAMAEKLASYRKSDVLVDKIADVIDMIAAKIDGVDVIELAKIFADGIQGLNLDNIGDQISEE